MTCAHAVGGAEPPVPHAPDTASTATAGWTAGVARGDRDAFAAFYAAWFDRALALAQRTLRSDEATALDVVQDVMMKVARSMPALRDERAVESWMARAVFSVAIDRLRADARRKNHEQEVVREVEQAPEPDRLELEERARWLHARLAELPDADRHAVLLRFEGDATLADIGAVLGITGNAVHGRVRRALARLRRMARQVIDGDA